MTEREWLTSTEPTPMLKFLRMKEKEGRLRQFALGCCYRIWHLLPDEGKLLLEMVDRFADGQVTRNQRDTAVAAFRAVHGRYGADTPILRAVYRSKNMSIDALAADIVAGDAAVAAGNAADGTARSAIYAAAYAAECAMQAVLLRCIIGNPFRPVVLDRAWLTPTVVALAYAAYDNRSFPAGVLESTRLAILSDALEEVGCTCTAILNHLRGPQTHVRGCWVVDLLLGKDDIRPVYPC
jgi:hypothetical protein